MVRRAHTYAALTPGQLHAATDAIPQTFAYLMLRGKQRRLCVTASGTLGKNENDQATQKREKQIPQRAFCSLLEAKPEQTPFPACPGSSREGGGGHPTEGTRLEHLTLNTYNGAESALLQMPQQCS